MEVRSTVGHDNGIKIVSAEPAAATPLRLQTRTAYASGDMPAAKTSVTMSDAAPSSDNPSPRDTAAAATGSTPSVAKSGDAANAEVKSEAAKSEAGPAAAQRGGAAPPD